MRFYIRMSLQDKIKGVIHKWWGSWMLLLILVLRIWGSFGPFYTLYNKRDGMDATWVRLERAIRNNVSFF